MSSLLKEGMEVVNRNGRHGVLTRLGDGFSVVDWPGQPGQQTATRNLKPAYTVTRWPNWIAETYDVRDCHGHKVVVCVSERAECEVWSQAAGGYVYLYSDGRAITVGSAHHALAAIRHARPNLTLHIEDSEKRVAA